MEVEGHGKLDMADDAALIKNYGELEDINVTDVVVGYTTQEIIVDDGEICGVIMDEPVVADSIRVIIMTDNYGSYYHDEVVVSSENGVVIEENGIGRSFEAGEPVKISTDMFGVNDRIVVKNNVEGGRIKLSMVILSIEEYLSL